MQLKNQTVGQILLEYLDLEKVNHIFGVPGGGLINMLVDLYEQKDRFDYIVCRQETGAAYMADGYYRVSGKLGVVMVTTGPGATNALTGVMNAEAANSAVLALTGEIAEQYFGMGYLQEGIDSHLDVNDVYKAAAAYSAVVSASTNAQTLIQAALRTALDVPRHAAHLSLPVNVTGEPVETIEMPERTSAYRTASSCAPMSAVTDALELLASSERPMIMLGNGCREALRDTHTAKALASFVEARGIPVITTADGKGVFPEDHPLSLRMFGIANSMWPYYWMNQQDPVYDALMVIGSGLGELATNKWNPMLRPKNGRIIQVDANARVIARDFPVALGVAGEAADFIVALARKSGEALPDASVVKARKAKVEEIRKNNSPFDSPEQYDSTADPVEPAALCRVMQDELVADTIVMLDAGNCVGWGCHYLVSKPGFEVHSSLDMGPMGFAVGAVVGAKVARPDATCLAFTGDGAFMMQGAEISTAQRNKLGAIWIVLHDNDLAMVSQGMEHYKRGDLAEWKKLFSLGEPDLAKYAEGLGADAYTISDPEGFRTALKSAVKGGKEGRPQVIVADINRNVEPPYYNELYAPPKKEVQALFAKRGM